MKTKSLILTSLLLVGCSGPDSHNASVTMSRSALANVAKNGRESALCFQQFEGVLGQLENTTLGIAAVMGEQNKTNLEFLRQTILAVPHKKGLFARSGMPVRRESFDAVPSCSALGQTLILDSIAAANVMQQNSVLMQNQQNALAQSVTTQAINIIIGGSANAGEQERESAAAPAQKKPDAPGRARTMLAAGDDLGDLTPEEFLALVRKADEVLSHSGTAFAKVEYEYNRGIVGLAFLAKPKYEWIEKVADGKIEKLFPAPAGERASVAFSGAPLVRLSVADDPVLEDELQKLLVSSLATLLQNNSLAQQNFVLDLQQKTTLGLATTAKVTNNIFNDKINYKKFSVEVPLSHSGQQTSQNQLDFDTFLKLILQEGQLADESFVQMNAVSMAQQLQILSLAFYVAPRFNISTSAPLSVDRDVFTKLNMSAEDELTLKVAQNLVQSLNLMLQNQVVAVQQGQVLRSTALTLSLNAILGE